MKLQIPSTSIATLWVSSISASVVATNILEHENSQGSIRHSATKNKECAFENSFKVNLIGKSSNNVGIPPCEIGELCAEDTTSSLGGRCIAVSSNHVALGPRRELTDPCNKCQGNGACLSVEDLSKIGCESCNGDYACFDSKSENIGAGSCQGRMACIGAQVDIGDNSCNGSKACSGIWGDDVPNDACNGVSVCQNSYEAPPDPPSTKPSIQPSSQPSESPSSQPSELPSDQPSGMPSESPSSQPSESPSEQPSGMPSDLPTSQPSESPSEQPSGMPSDLPSSQPSESPSESPSEQPSGMPSESPSSQPSESSSEQLSGMPSELPSSQPSAAPSIDPFQQAARIEIVIPSTISLSGFQTPSPEELPTVVSILAANVAAVVSSSLNSSQRVKSVNIISINGVLVTGFSLRRLIVRNLSEATVEYEILLEEICSNDGCSDADTAAQALYKQATDAMREEIDSGAFATAVISDADSANVNALLEIAVASSDFSSVILNLVGLIFSESPSSEPSGTPSCTPSSAPTPSPSINLFYPDQFTSGKCLNDGRQPAWMEANPSAWLFTTLEKCCTQHASWNQQGCVGSHPQECATTLWYPDWAGTNKGCLRDGNEPLFMVQNPSDFIFSDKASCCAEHYSWNEASCLGGVGGTNISYGTSTASSGSKYYADWTSGDKTCKNDGAAPEYMIKNAAIWLYDELDECCETYFNYKLAECKGSTATSANAGLYYPDWTGDNKGCKENSGTTLAPDTLTDSYFYATLDGCCEKHYLWTETSCKNGGSSATTGTGTDKWYVKWSDGACYKDCTVGGTDCGGLAGYYETNNLHDTKAKCCSTHLWYDYKNCLE